MSDHLHENTPPATFADSADAIVIHIEQAEREQALAALQHKGMDNE
ncbi:hypothetical protein [Shewanella frigidimarina]|nr:hypothetical protein [Shewanella frigidimarina]